VDISNLLRQQVAWVPATGINNRGEATFGPMQYVPARVQPKFRDIIGPTGELTSTSQLIVTLVEPAIGDRLNGREVIQVTGMVDFLGNEAGFQSLTR